MGQRCAILIKRNFKDNKSTIDLIHHQWGIGKTLGALFLGQLLECEYSCNRNKANSDNYVPARDEFTFKPLYTYIHNLEVATDDKKYNVWNKKARMELLRQCDNNNGGMVIEVTQKYDENGRAITYGDMLDVKIGFLLGNEETDFYHKNFSDYIAIEQPFERVVTCREFVNRTFARGIEGGSNEMFIQSFNKLCNLFGVQQVNNKKGAKRIKDKWLAVKTLANTFTKDLGEREIIDIPKELKEHTLIFN